MDTIELAVQAYLQENYVEITDYAEDLQTKDDPLAICIKKDLYEKLSKDARDVIDLVLNTSMETFTSILSPNGIKCYYEPKKKTTPNIKLIERYLRWMWKWSGSRIYKTIDEIKLFLSDI